MESTARVQNKLFSKEYVEKLDNIEEQFQKVMQKIQKEKEIESNSVPK